MKISTINDQITVEVSHSDLQDLDCVLAAVIGPCLREFAKHTDTYPDKFENPGQWMQAVNIMADGFEGYNDATDSGTNPHEGIALFGKYFRHFWF